MWTTPIHETYRSDSVQTTSDSTPMPDKTRIETSVAYHFMHFITTYLTPVTRKHDMRSKNRT